MGDHCINVVTPTGVQFLMGSLCPPWPERIHTSGDDELIGKVGCKAFVPESNAEHKLKMESRAYKVFCHVRSSRRNFVVYRKRGGASKRRISATTKCLEPMGKVQMEAKGLHLCVRMLISLLVVDAGASEQLLLLFGKKGSFEDNFGPMLSPCWAHVCIINISIIISIIISIFIVSALSSSASSIILILRNMIRNYPHTCFLWGFLPHM